jgi:hypothetical protein
MTYPNGGTILPVRRISRVSGPSRILLDQTYLLGFGDMLIPRHLWIAMQRFDAWIEPALVAEWTRLIKFYASRRGERVDDGKIAVAMTWEVPTRDVRLARKQAIKLSKNGQLFCVWSGKRLSGELIWSAWPCGDLWNLMPTHRSVNQREKRSRLPADRLLRASEDRIINWWHAAYIQDQPSLREQFWLAASSSLPCIRAENDSLHDVFDAVSLQRVKLKHDQQVPEWMGEKYVGIAERPQVQEDIARDCEM